jgi:hypothetical protein
MTRADAMGLLLAFIARLITGAQGHWKGCPPKAEQRIYFANHQSHLDWVLIWAALPRELRATTRPDRRRDYWTSSPLQALAHARGVQRGLRQPPAHGRPGPAGAAGRRAAQRRLAGHLSRKAHAATRATRSPSRAGCTTWPSSSPQVQLIPAWIDNVQRVMPKGEVVPVPILCTVTFGAPMQLQPGEDKRVFLTAPATRCWPSGHGGHEPAPPAIAEPSTSRWRCSSSPCSVCCCWPASRCRCCSIARDDDERFQRELRLRRDLRAVWVGALVFWVSLDLGAGGRHAGLRRVLVPGAARVHHAGAHPARRPPQPDAGLLRRAAAAVPDRGLERFDLFSVFIPVYVFLAIPVVSALAGDPERFLERNAKIQWGIMVCVYGLSHAPALLLLDLPASTGAAPSCCSSWWS